MGVLQASRNLSIHHNVSLRVLDAHTGNVVQQHTGHNAATNSMLTGIAHYLTGDGVLNQGYHMLSAYVPKYISLGTMGLINQESDSSGLPIGIGCGVTMPSSISGASDAVRSAYEAWVAAKQALDAAQSNLLYSECACSACASCQRCRLDGSEATAEKQAYDDAKADLDAAVTRYLAAGGSESERFVDYMEQCPGFGADGYDLNQNNNRPYAGLGPVYANRLDSARTVNCELVSATFPRASISYREVVPEMYAELPKTIDVVFSALISTGALAQFREPGKDYVYITEAGLWSTPNWSDSGDNGLLAGYRIAPPDEQHWDMTIESNRNILKREILRVGWNQVVQVIWKVQLGGIEQLIGLDKIISGDSAKIYWNKWK